MRVRDHRAVDRLPGIDVKAARLAVEPLRRRANHHASAPSAPARTFRTISTTAISTTPNSKAATGHGTNHLWPRRERYHTMYTGSAEYVHTTSGTVARVNRNGVK